jgi:hypothetical protein
LSAETRKVYQSGYTIYNTGPKTTTGVMLWSWEIERATFNLIGNDKSWSLWDRAENGQDV